MDKQEMVNFYIEKTKAGELGAMAAKLVAKEQLLGPTEEQCELIFTNEKMAHLQKKILMEYLTDEEVKFLYDICVQIQDKIGDMMKLNHKIIGIAQTPEFQAISQEVLLADVA